MNKQKLISVLQSRIAKRRMLLKTGWNSFADKDYKHDRRFLKFRLIKLGLEQKEDKQILKQLVEDERSIKEWKARFDTASKALGIIAGMREKI